jgi:hypothetical protein
MSYTRFHLITPLWKHTMLIILKYLWIMLIFTSSLSFAQIIEIPDTLPKEIREYLKLLTSYSSTEQYVQDRDTISINRLKNYASIINAASERDSYLKLTYYDTVVRKSKDLVNSTFREPDGPSIIASNLVLGMIMEKVQTELPPIIEKLLYADYIIKGEIIRSEPFEYQVQGSNSFITKVNVTVKILEVIKGDWRLVQGDEVTFEYLPYNVSLDLFNPGEVCLLPLRKWGFYGDTFGLVYMKSPEESISWGKLPIQNNIVIDKDNYFGQGEQLPWDMMKMHIVEQLILIRSWDSVDD